jgi:hypothetical protein
MVFGGSSVTAGHDNQMNQSYPLIFQKRMKPTFQSLGIDLIVHNIAQGANDCLPSDLCYETMGGYQSDFYSWYEDISPFCLSMIFSLFCDREQSFNCGRNPEYVDTLAYLAAKKGASFYVAASGGVLPICNKSTDSVPYSRENWTPKLVPKLTPWMPTPGDLKKMRERTIYVNSLASSAERSQQLSPFSSLPILFLTFPFRFAPILKKYPSVSGSGVNMWTTYPKSLCQNVPGKIFQKSCNPDAIYSSCALKFLNAELQEYGLGHGAKWHPTAALHMLRGELLVWLYGLTLLDAMFTTQDLLRTETPQQIFKGDLHNPLLFLFFFSERS